MDIVEISTYVLFVFVSRVCCLFRTHGVSIFIDYCPAAAIQREVKEKERDIGLITRMRLAAV